MSKQAQMKNMAKYAVYGMVIGSAVGTAVSVMARPRTAYGLRSKASNALETVGSIMQNVAEFTR